MEPPKACAPDSSPKMGCGRGWGGVRFYPQDWESLGNPSDPSTVMGGGCGPKEGVGCCFCSSHANLVLSSVSYLWSLCHPFSVPHPCLLSPLFCVLFSLCGCSPPFVCCSLSTPLCATPQHPVSFLFFEGICPLLGLIICVPLHFFLALLLLPSISAPASPSLRGPTPLDCPTSGA